MGCYLEEIALEYFKTGWVYSTKPYSCSLPEAVSYFNQFDYPATPLIVERQGDSVVIHF
jgi:hypothetical protein